MIDVYLEDLLCAAILAFFAMQGAVPFIAPNQALEATNAAASGLTFYGGIASQLLVYGGIGFLILRHLRRVTRWLGAMQWAGALALLAIASTVWSQFPMFTIRRSLPFALAGLFGLYLAARFSLRRQLSILWLAMAAVALGTIVMAVFFPKLGLDASAGHHNDWQGVFTQKNACGRMMVLATAVVLAGRRFSILRAMSLLLFFFVLLMSGSRGAWVVEALVIGIYAAMKVAKHLDGRGRVVVMVIAVCCLPVVVLAAALSLPTIAPLLGRDITLSGRTEIWKHVWPFVLRRPFMGWGYAAFWRGTQGESFRVAAALGFVVFHAHNGFLEIWLELGIGGLALFGASYLRGWRKLWPAIRSGEIDRCLWMVLVLVLIALFDLDENTLLTFNGLFWVLYVAALANIEMLAVEERSLRTQRSYKGVATALAAAVECP